MKQGETDGACDVHGTEDIRMLGFDCKARKKEAIWKSSARMRR